MAAEPGGLEEAKRLRATHPDWLLPAWASGGPAVWTIVGAPYGGQSTIIAPDGSFAPRNHGPGVTFWLYDLDAGRLLAPADHAPRVRLAEGRLPIVTSTWHAGDLRVEMTFFTGWPEGDVATWFGEQGEGSEQAVTFVRLSVSTTAAVSRHLAAYVALRPFGVEPALHDLSDVACQVNPPALLADGKLVLVSVGRVDGCGVATLAQDDLSTWAQRNQVPSEPSVHDPLARAAGMLRLPITAQSDAPGMAELRAPLAPRTPNAANLAALTGGSFDEERARVAEAWREALGRVTLDLSDSRFNDAFVASQAYLLMNRRDAWPRPGPLLHDAFWVRDTAYIGEALERVGYGTEHEATLEALLGLQREDGSFPAIVDRAGPRAVDEWDAQGEAIFAFASHYRFRRDRAWLERVYPTMVRAAEFLDALRARTAQDGPETRGLLPPSLSAEDLGPDTWHHYWDDFWALAGYRELAYAARELGREAEAEAFEQRAEAFQRDLLGSIGAVQARTSIFFIPNAPEDVASSSNIRGTTPALWPVRTLHGQRELLLNSFVHYWATGIGPYGGAYPHYQDSLWPYGGLGVAHAMLRLGMLDEVWQILSWTIEHPTLPGAWAWAEAVDRQHGGLAFGDMPHSWAAAELISLLRDMVLAEEYGWLVVNGGTPWEWLEPGKHVILRNAPSHYGRANVSLVRDEAGSDGAPPDLHIELEGEPPMGWIVRLPGRPSGAEVDGSPAEIDAYGRLWLTSGNHTIRVGYGVASSRYSWLVERWSPLRPLGAVPVNR